METSIVRLKGCRVRLKDRVRNWVEDVSKQPAVDYLNLMRYLRQHEAISGWLGCCRCRNKP